MMPKRYPRPKIKRYPRNEVPKDFTINDLKNAIRKNGCVDLNKIRYVVDRNVNERRERAKKIVKTKKEHDEIFDKFLNIYKKYMNIEFIPNTKERFVTYNQNGKRIARRYRTDRARLIEFYLKTKKKYGGRTWHQRWEKYIDRVLYLAVEEYELTQQNKIFGLLVSDKIVDDFFVNILREERRERRKSKRLESRIRHLEMFENE